MDGVRAVLLALLCCLAPLGGAVAVAGSDAGPGSEGGPAAQAATSVQEDDGDRPGMTIVNRSNTSEYLAPSHDDVDRTGQGTASLDVAGAVGADAGDLRAELLDESLRSQFEAAEDEAERRAVVANGTERLSERARAIDARHARTVERYNERALTEAGLFRSLASIDREARATIETVTWLEQQADRLGMDEEADALSSERVRLLLLLGPIRERLNDAHGGDADVRVHVDTVEEGLVLVTMEQDVSGQLYLREASDPTARATDVADRYDGSPTNAFDRIEALYPWVIENVDSIADARPIGSTTHRVYRFQVAHPHGDLETFLDGGSGDILREVQATDPERQPSTTVETVEGDLRLRVERTYAGGPLGVAVIDTETDEPVDADVTINEAHVGSTGADRLWTVAPRGEVTINASYDGESVTLEETLE